MVQSDILLRPWVNRHSVLNSVLKLPRSCNISARPDSPDILTVVRESLYLKRSGSRWGGPVPFHNETSTSLSVTPPSSGKFRRLQKASKPGGAKRSMISPKDTTSLGIEECASLAND